MLSLVKTQSAAAFEKAMVETIAAAAAARSEEPIGAWCEVGSHVPDPLRLAL